ncbi:hypothetical protein A5625_26775 [Mycobacterium sp. 1465703.0]|nr:hypothetical protein A5625_26775 [Mycobacterium sp. 1465703.0]
MPRRADGVVKPSNRAVDSSVLAKSVPEFISGVFHNVANGAALTWAAPLPRVLSNPMSLTVVERVVVLSRRPVGPGGDIVK